MKYDETTVRSDLSISHYFGQSRPFLVAFDVEALAWTEVDAPHEEVAALLFWQAAEVRPINQMLVREPGAELAAQILIEASGEVAWVTDVEVAA